MTPDWIVAASAGVGIIVGASATWARFTRGIDRRVYSILEHEQARGDLPTSHRIGEIQRALEILDERTRQIEIKLDNGLLARTARLEAKIDELLDRP